MPSPRKPIVVVGSVSMDLVTVTPKIPRIGQTVVGTSFGTTPGGKGANQAVAAARLGYPTRMVGKVGRDVYGPALLENLASSGVLIDGMEQVDGASGLAPIFVSESGENAIVIVQGSNGKVDRATVDRHADLIHSAGIVLCQLELPIDTTCYVLELCSAAGVPTILDPAPAAPLPDSAFSHISWFTPNETEAAFYLGESLSVEEGAKRLFDRGLKGVVLKRGGEGSYVAVAGGHAAWVKPFHVQAIDTVAAGDCFNGAFAVALMEGNTPWEAARFANAAAAISVTRRGAQQSMPSRAEVDLCLTEHA